MNEVVVEQTASRTETRGALSALVLLFIGSGCAALIYEVVWFQLLELVIGSSTVSIGVLLGTFMGGMCLGSFLAPRLVARTHHPLRVYAFLELGIGIIGLLVLMAMPLVGGVYTAWAGEGLAGMLLRGIVAALCLLPPTLLMGATLPAISRWVEATPAGVSWLGFFYGGNIAGAVIGCLLAGFYLLRVHDVAIATFVAAAINITVAVMSLVIAKRTPYEPPVAAAKPARRNRSQDAGIVYLVIGLSGMTALASQVIWTRLLSLLFGATVYTFSLILAVFLFGLGIGSSLGSAMARSIQRPRIALGWCQLMLCVAMAWTAYELMASLPFWPINVTLTANPWIKVQLDFVRAMWAILPAAILWGASFPLALAAVATRDQDPGEVVGRVYAANTVGAIVGSLVASLLLVAWLGTQQSLQILIAASAISALFILALPPAHERQSAAAFGGTLIGVVGVSALLVMTVPPIPREFVAYGRFLPTRGGQGDVFYVGEGLTASVAVSRLPDGTLNYHNAGKIQASSDPADMRLQRMLGHLTTLIPANARTFVVIGCGAGVTAGAVSIEPRMEKMTIVEIEPLVPEVVSTHFAEQNFDVIRNPKVEVRIDDGRHFLQTTDLKFDGITSDPLDPWVKGAAMLYTREFFELAKSRLNEGGVVTQFVQLYESTEEAVKSEIGTFFEVFPHGSIWANTVQGQGYDLVLLGQAEPTVINVDDLQARLESPEYAAVARSLQEIGFYSGVQLLATFAGQGPDLQPWLRDAVITRDRNLRLQYLAGLGLNLYRANEIYMNMTAFGPYMPEGLFTGSEPLLQSLARAIETGAVR